MRKKPSHFSSIIAFKHFSTFHISGLVSKQTQQGTSPKANVQPQQVLHGATWPPQDEEIRGRWRKVLLFWRQTRIQLPISDGFLSTSTPRNVFPRFGIINLQTFVSMLPPSTTWSCWKVEKFYRCTYHLHISNFMVRWKKRRHQRNYRVTEARDVNCHCI